MNGTKIKKQKHLLRNRTGHHEQLEWSSTTVIDNDLKYFNRKFTVEEVKLNLNSDEIRALMRLKNNKEIISKPADKGRAVVIMDHFQYLWEGNRQLMDRKYYIPLTEPIFPKTVPMVQEILNDLKK